MQFKTLLFNMKSVQKELYCCCFTLLFPQLHLQGCFTLCFIAFQLLSGFRNFQASCGSNFLPAEQTRTFIILRMKCLLSYELNLFYSCILPTCCLKIQLLPLKGFFLRKVIFGGLVDWFSNINRRYLQYSISNKSIVCNKL